MTALARLCIATTALAVAATVAAQPAAREAERTIVNLRGDLYVARFDNRASMFLVTPEGIVVTDPIGTDAASWLRGELTVRFPGLTVRYVLISHHHFDRAAGASVFGDGAETVGHRLFNEELRSAGRSSNYSDVKPVKRLYDTRERIAIGGRNVEMVYAGPAHARDLSVIFFPDERVVFAVDTLNTDKIPYSFGPYSPVEVAGWLDAVGALDFDLMVDGEGKTTGATAIKQLRPYIRDLVDAVTQGVIAGRGLGRLRSQILLPMHRDNPNYVARAQHIESVSRSLTVHNMNVSLGGAGNLLSTTTYCAGYATCNTFGGLLAGGTVGLDYSLGSYGFGAEFSSGPQLVVSRSSRLYDDSVANRRTTASFLGRYRIGAGFVAADLLGGATMVMSDTRGLNLVKEAETPFGGRHGIVSSKTFTGFIVGVDVVVPVAARWTVRVPVRFSSVQTGNDELHPGSQDVQFGIGLGFRLAQGVYHTPGQPLPIVVRSGQSSPASGRP